jgi:peptidoglycan-N-acetylglucosamine deacetylase
MFGIGKLTFGRTSTLFLLGLAVLAVGSALFGLPFWTCLVWLCIYLAILVYGSISINSGFYVNVLCSGPCEKKEIAITFDDGPSASHTREVLEVLKANQVPAAFFCIGNRISSSETVLRQIHAEGHLIANHSYSHHFWFDLFSSRKMLRDLQAMDQATQRATGLLPRLFRPPYGVTNPNLGRAIKAGNYIAVGWSIRALDTVIRDEEKLLGNILRKLKPGAIILLHDAGPSTLAVLPSLISRIQEAGYQITRLDKMLNLEPYA